MCDVCGARAYGIPLTNNLKRGNSFLELRISVVRVPFLHNSVTPFKLFLYVYTFQGASIELGFFMAFSKALPC